jgi:hypothetical protein
MSTVSYSLGNSKPLINREQHYVLDRRLLTVHSTDRDITKWKHSNHFEIMLPETMYNVQTLRLVQSSFPGIYYTFSNDYQNTKFWFNTASHPTPMLLEPIQEGLYTTNQLAVELTNKMNETMVSNSVTTDGSFNVFFNEVSQKYFIGNTSATFTLLFATQVIYDTSCNNYENNPTMWFQYANWGLPYYLGFDKKNYSSINNPPDIDYLENCCCTTPTPVTINNYVEAPFTANISGEKCIYMEVDKYNSYDELYPYNKSSCQMYDNNAYNGKVNSAFAKIPIRGNNTEQDSRTLFLQNIVEYDPPIERIARLTFKFRFHDGRLVDFQNNNFDFTIEFNCLKNEIYKQYTVRIPATYNL